MTTWADAVSDLCACSMRRATEDFHTTTPAEPLPIWEGLLAWEESR